MADTIQAFIHRKVVVLRETSSVYEASRAMCENNIGSVVVSDGEGHMTGIVTDRDVACAVVSLNQSPDTELVEIMTPSPAKVSETATVAEVVKLMKERGIRRVPVVHLTRHGVVEKCVGMVSLDDLIVSRMISADEVAEIVRSQVYRRRKKMPSWRAESLHSEKSTDKFLRLFETRTQLTEARAMTFLALVLGLIVRRVHFTSAADLIAQLPERLRSELLDLPAGPDRSINGDRILQEASTRFDISKDHARGWVVAMWESLVASLPEGAEADLAEEIPDDIRILLVALPEGAPSKGDMAGSSAKSATSPKSDAELGRGRS